MEVRSLVSSSYVPIIIAGLIITSIFFFYLYAKYKLSYWKRRGVKSPVAPAAHIIFGNMRESILLKKTPGQVLRDIYYSVDPDEPFVGCYLFHKPLLIVRSLPLIKQIMIKDYELFPDRGFGGKSEADPLGYVSLLGIRKPRWKYLRGKLTPCLTGQKLRNMLPLVIECCHKLVDHIEAAAAHGSATAADQQRDIKSFDLKSIASKYCTDVFASTAFGVTTNSFDENDTEFWQAGQRVLAGLKRGIILIIHFFLPELIPITSLVSKGPAQFFSDVFWDSYKTRERIGNKRGDLVDFLMALRNVGQQNPHFIFDGDNLVAQAVSFYVAGFEATSTTIAFALYDLSKNPIYEEQAYEEVIRIAGHHRELTMEMLNEMTFLENCINESLRLHPPLPMVDRISVRDYQIPGTGIILEKGTTIYVATCGTNTDPRFFKNPQTFDPTRTSAKDLGFSAAHLSFGIGPRSCIGQRFGLVITKTAMAMILRKYTLICEASAEDRELSAGSVFTTTVDGIPLRIQKRN